MLRNCTFIHDLTKYIQCYYEYSTLKLVVSELFVVFYTHQQEIKITEVYYGCLVKFRVVYEICIASFYWLRNFSEYNVWIKSLQPLQECLLKFMSRTNIDRAWLGMWSAWMTCTLNYAHYKHLSTFIRLINWNERSRTCIRRVLKNFKLITS